MRLCSNARSVFEIVEENPFLANFYQDRNKYAFQTQLFFLLSRFKQQQELFQQELFSQVTVSDYLFAKDKIFASLTLSAEELTLYHQIYQLLNPRLPRPDLVVYLQARPDRARAYGLGAAEYVTKPFPLDALVGVIAAFDERAPDGFPGFTHKALQAPARRLLSPAAASETIGEPSARIGVGGVQEIPEGPESPDGQGGREPRRG